MQKYVLLPRDVKYAVTVWVSFHSSSKLEFNCDYLSYFILKRNSNLHLFLAWQYRITNEMFSEVFEYRLYFPNEFLEKKIIDDLWGAGTELLLSEFFFKAS